MAEQGIPFARRLPLAHRFSLGSALGATRIAGHVAGIFSRAKQLGSPRRDAGSPLRPTPHPLLVDLERRNCRAGGLCLGRHLHRSSHPSAGSLHFSALGGSRHRRQGLGKALIQQVERWGSQQQLAAITLQVYRHNQAALNFYSRPTFCARLLAVQTPWPRCCLAGTGRQRYEVL